MGAMGEGQMHGALIRIRITIRKWRGTPTRGFERYSATTSVNTRDFSCFERYM